MLWLKRFWPLLLGILYLVSPIDAIPDTLLGLGWADDIVLLLLAYWFVKRVLPGGYKQTGGYHSGGQGREESEPGAGAAEDPYEILDVSRNATPEEIKSAYRKKAQRYHPDRVAHLGDEFQQLAKQKFQEIQKAYEILSNGKS
jgi:uncharacterized membrane protein YkvA (DUF1232 family)